MFLKRWSPKDLKQIMAKCKDRATISQLHGFMISSGLLSHGNSSAQLIRSCARYGYIDLARKMLEKLPNRGTDAWNAMIIAYSHADCPYEVIDVFNQMSCEGVKADSSTFTMAIKACTGLMDLDSGEKIWKKAVLCGYGNDVFVGASVLNLYAKCGKMDEAVAVFTKLPRRDVFCWTAIIMGYVQSGRVRLALDTYRQMKKEGIEGDGVVVLGVIQALANTGDVKMSCSVHGYIVRKNIPMDIIMQTSLVDMYAKIGELKLASRVFWRMPEKNVVSWSAMVSGYSQNGYVANALELLVDMQRLGYEPNLVSLVSALLACSQVGFSKLGRSIHGYVLKRHDADEYLVTALIDMYAKCGSIPCARNLYDSMSSRDLICCNAMISSYGLHGDGKEALSLFKQMIALDLKPNHATFASLLSALSHSGLVEEGRYWFDLMIKEYKIQPTAKHYAYLVDLLARAGRVDEALSLINSMTGKPGLAVWVALLSGCHNHKKLLVGKVAAKNILELNPDNSGILTLLSNFFAMAGMWDEVSEIKKTMKTRGMKKVPGHSVAEVNGLLHAFLVEDKSHPQYKQIQILLDKLEQEMMALGYSPRTKFVLHNVEEDVKVKMLCNHSERLAIAFALLNTGPGTGLLITKNLRVCGDCHEAIKFISIITKREIIVRDVKRFHHFKEGLCSCRDYW